MTNDATRWIVKGWDDETIEYEDEEGKWVAWEDHRDILQAAVAAEQEANAMIADEWYSRMEEIGRMHPEDSVNRSRCFARARQAMYIAEDIRARTPADTDAQAALEAVKREARNEALREAAEAAGVKGIRGGKPVSGPHHAGIRDGRNEARRLILALMEDTDDD